MDAMTSQITSLTIVYSTVYSGADQRKHESSASLAFVRGIHRWPVNSPHKKPVTQKMLPFDDVIMRWREINKEWCTDWIGELFMPSSSISLVILEWANKQLLTEGQYIRYWFFNDVWYPSQVINHAKSIFISWRHHVNSFTCVCGWPHKWSRNTYLSYTIRQVERWFLTS